MTYAFDMFLASFMGSEAQRQMEATVEDSPWHREANVWQHTEMVMAQYRQRFAPFRSDLQNNIALFALLFHDVGKPSAEEVLTREDGTAYRRYAGHEQDSAVAFTQEYVRNQELRNLLDARHARIVRWIIEHHLPYGLKDTTKRGGLFMAINSTMAGIEDTFYDCLRSDAAGRISDDHAEKLQKVEDWITEFRAQTVTKPEPTRNQTVYMLVGPSASGKSTWTMQHSKVGDVIVSMDTLRLEYARLVGQPQGDTETSHQFYERAWKLACIDDAKAFNSYAARIISEQFAAAARQGGNVFVDIVNASRKKRAMFIELGRKYGFRIIGVEFWNSVETLLARQQTRPDKSVPKQSVLAQVYASTCMWLGYECEDVVLVIGDK